MAINHRFTTAINRFLDVPSLDPEDARRRKLLNIILAGLAILGLVIVVITFVIDVLNLMPITAQDIQSIYFSGAGLFLGTGLFYAINRNSRVPGWIASVLFLLFLMVVLAYTDTPDELSAGRSLFVFFLPVIMAGILLKPVYSFVFSILVSIEIIILAKVGNTGPNVLAIVTYFMVAILTWLSSRGIEQALKDLRQINANLDRLVQERTKELADALASVRIEAGRSKAILEGIADGVIVFNMQGVAIIANPSTVNLLGMSHEELVGSTIGKLSQAEAMDIQSRVILAGLLYGPGSQAASYHIQWGKKTLSATSAQVTDTEGVHIGTVAVFRDYTREAELERMKSTFLAIVSHELRTPLNAILGYAEMLKEAIYGPVNEKQARASERILGNSRRLLDIVSDLLDQAQMEAGKLSLHMKPFRPADLIENVHGVMDKIAADKGLVLTSELDPRVPEIIIGDIARLQQILVNLINNAIKFTEKGSVHVRMECLDKRHWLLEVADTGIGISENELPNIFEAFRQVDSTVTRKYGGFGLGLAIVKQLTELMGGFINVNSQLGVGSSFTITLPLTQAKRSV